MLEQLELAVCAFGQHGRAEGLHDLLDGDSLSRELVLGRAGRGQSINQLLIALRLMCAFRRERRCIPDQAERSHAYGLQIRVPAHTR